MVEPTGAQTHVVFSLSGEPITAVVDGGYPARHGMTFEGGVPAEQVHVFDRETGMAL